MAVAMEHALRIAADEVNCLIYAYLLDSGFMHAAFAVKMEAQLDRSPHSSKHIPRGELVELLSKSLLYIEVESHWKDGGLPNDCKSGFSLLEPHVCSLEPPTVQSIKATHAPAIFTDTSTKQPKASGLTVDAGPKRKESPSTTERPAEKRVRRDLDDMDLGSSAESTKAPNTLLDPGRSINIVSESAKKPIAKPRTRRGPGDDATDPKVILYLPGHKAEVFGVKFNPGKRGLLATGAKDAVVNLWNLQKPPDTPGVFASHVAPIVIDYFAKREGGDITSLDWNADGTLLAVGCFDSVLRICTSNGSLYFSNPQHQGPIFATRFSKSGKWLLTASLDGTACLWDVKEKRLHRQYRSHEDCCLDVEWLNDSTFVTCGADTRIFITRVDSVQPFRQLVGHGSEVNQLKRNPASTLLASCSDDMTARIWNISGLELGDADDIPGLTVTHKAVTVMKGHSHSVSTVAWCPDPTIGQHPLVATSSFDKTARLWDSVTGECLKVFTDHKHPVYALAFSPDGNWLATGGGDGWVYVYSVWDQSKRWSWYAGAEKPGVFEIDWEMSEGINRIALALECGDVAVIEVNKIPSLKSPPTRRPGTKMIGAT